MNTPTAANDVAAVAEAVELRRTQRSLSVYQLAIESGIARSTLQRRLSGEISFSVTELRSVARVLGVHPAILLAAAKRKVGAA